MRGARTVAMPFVTAVCVVVIACGGMTDVPATSNGLFPLTTGTSWTYHSTDSVIGPPIAGDQVEPDSDFTVEVLGDTTDASGTGWAVLSNAGRLFGPDFSPVTPYYANASDGLRRLGVGGGSSGTPFILTYLIFAYPATRGQVMHFGPVVSSVDTTISVPAGTFRCLRYDLVTQPTPGPIPIWSVFVSPGIGIVQRIVTQIFVEDGKGQVVSRRDRYYRLTRLTQ